MCIAWVIRSLGGDICVGRNVNCWGIHYFSVLG